MPVLRERHKVSPTIQSRAGYVGSGGIVHASSGVTETGDMWGAAAAELGRWSGRIGSLMATQAREEGRAMAQTVKLNDRFEPELDADVAARKRMGVIAGQAYDSALEERQRTRITAMVMSEIEKVKAIHPDDVEAFSREAGSVIAGLQEGMPPDLAGVFSDATYTALARYGADVGMAQGAARRRNALGAYQADARLGTDLMFEAALRGDADFIQNTAEGLRRHAAGVRGQNLITDADVAELETTINAMTGLGGVLGTMQAENWSSGQMIEVITDLRAGGLEYGWEGSTHRSRQVAANQLESLVGRRIAEERAQREEAVIATNRSNVLNGGYAGDGDAKPEGSSLTARQIMSEAIGQRFGVVSDVAAWLSGEPFTQSEEVYVTMERGGILDHGLHRALVSFSNGRMEGTDAANVYDAWRRMTNFVTATGQPMRIMEDIPEEAIPLLSMMDMLVDGANETPQRAYETVQNYLANPPNNAAIIEKMQGSTTFLGRMALAIPGALGIVSADSYEFGVTNVADRLSLGYAGLLRLSPWHTVEEARSALIEGGAERLDEHLHAQFDSMLRVGLGIQHIRTQDVSNAVELFKMSIMHSNASPTALANSIVKQTTMRYAETDMLTDGISPVRRAAAAPEVRWRLPEENSIFGVITQNWINDGGELRRLTPGDIAASSSAALGVGALAPSAALGVSAADAVLPRQMGYTWFEAWADKELRDRLPEEAVRRFGPGAIEIGQGGDILLKAQGDPQARFPRYQVYRRGIDGTPEPLIDPATGGTMILDPRGDYEARVLAANDETTWLEQGSAWARREAERARNDPNVPGPLDLPDNLRRQIVREGR